MIHDYLNNFIKKYEIDFVIANGENASHGKGLLQNHYQELLDNGVDVITLGNHYDGKIEIRRYIERVSCLIRPINIVQVYPGEGTAVFDVDGISVRVTNVLGSAFMNEPVNNPYYALLETLDDEEEANIHIVDFHAEATGEKVCLAHAFDGRVSAVLGTHTHVQTKDARIFPKGTAFISDVGMTGFSEGSLGVDIDSVSNKLLFGGQGKFIVPDEGKGIFSAVVLDIDNYTGKANSITPIYYLE